MYVCIYIYICMPAGAVSGSVDGDDGARQEGGGRIHVEETVLDSR